MNVTGLVEKPIVTNIARLAGMDRKDIGSWLSGSAWSSGNLPGEFQYPGNRLGLPEAGPGSVVSLLRRALAFFIDYFASMAIAHLFAPSLDYLSNSFRLLTLEIMFGQMVLFTALIGASFGQRLLRIRVASINGQRLGVGRVIVRTLLIFLVIPAVIWDRDGRGMHDRIVGSVSVKAN